ncbi:hypothetical protein AMELA_G00103230, partial [Ameiurus melas]
GRGPSLWLIQVFISESREKQEQVGQRAHDCQKNHDHRQIFRAADGAHLYNSVNLDTHEQNHETKTHTNVPDFTNICAYGTVICLTYMHVLVTR